MPLLERMRLKLRIFAYKMMLRETRKYEKLRRLGRNMTNKDIELLYEYRRSGLIAMKTLVVSALFLITVILLIPISTVELNIPNRMFTPHIFISPDSELQDEKMPDGELQALSVGTIKMNTWFERIAFWWVFRSEYKNLKDIEGFETPATTERKTDKDALKLTYEDDLFNMQQSAYLEVHRLLGVNIPYTLKWEVTEVNFKSTETPVLFPGDTILRIDGKSVKEQSDFYLYKVEPTQHSLEVVRGDMLVTVNSTLEGVVLKKKVTFDDPATFEDFIETVHLGLPGFSGNSAGTALALEYYMRLTGEDLLKGQKISVTGALDEQGNIKPVGGIPQKTYLAVKGDMDLLIVPTDNEYAKNYTEAKIQLERQDSKLEVRAFSTFTELLTYLRER